MEEEEAKRRLEEEKEEKKRAKDKLWEDIVKAGGGSSVFNATAIEKDGGEGDILFLSKTHVVVYTAGQLKAAARNSISNIANTGTDSMAIMVKGEAWFAFNVSSFGIETLGRFFAALQKK
jgi:hypothetical protein